MPENPDRPRKRANALDGVSWTRNSISVWSDIRRTAAEKALKHPAMFPLQLVARLIECFTPPGPGTILDPFGGVGSTPLAASLAGKTGIGIELSADYIRLANARHESTLQNGDPPTGDFRMIQADAADLGSFIEPCSVQLCVTSPPYWNILQRKRSADHKTIRHYGDQDGDLGRIEGYPEFLDALQAVFREVFAALIPGGYCCVAVMDIRRGSQFYPFHSDLAQRLTCDGYIFDDLIIWDRRHEYNNLRPLGYPAVFRINKVHEFVVIFRKPTAAHASPSTSHAAGLRSRGRTSSCAARSGQPR